MPGRKPRSASRRYERAQRILDAAAALILRWGYNKTAVDDIARQAGVAKGTIYLHWNTREELFAALMKREKLALTQDLKRRLDAHPAGATLHGMLRHSALALMQRPLLKAVLLRDLDVVGKLVQSEQSSAAYAERIAGFKLYLEFLREHKLVRADLDLQAQVYMVSAIFMGFFLVAPLMPEDLALSDERLAELMAETVRCTLGPSRALTDADVAEASQAFMRHLDRSLALAEEQFARELETPPVREEQHL